MPNRSLKLRLHASEKRGREVFDIRKKKKKKKEQKDRDAAHVVVGGSSSKKEPEAPSVIHQFFHINKKRRGKGPLDIQHSGCFRDGRVGFSSAPWP